MQVRYVWTSLKWVYHYIITDHGITVLPISSTPTASPYPLPLVIPRCVYWNTHLWECHASTLQPCLSSSETSSVSLGCEFGTHPFSLPSSRTPNLDIKAPKKHHEWPNYTLRLQFHVQNHSDKQTASATNSAGIRQRMALNSSGDRAEWKSRLPQSVMGLHQHVTYGKLINFKKWGLLFTIFYHILPSSSGHLLLGMVGKIPTATGCTGCLVISGKSINLRLGIPWIPIFHLRKIGFGVHSC